MQLSRLYIYVLIFGCNGLLSMSDTELIAAAMLQGYLSDIRAAELKKAERKYEKVLKDELLVKDTLPSYEDGMFDAFIKECFSKFIFVRGSLGLYIKEPALIVWYSSKISDALVTCALKHVHLDRSSGSMLKITADKAVVRITKQDIEKLMQVEGYQVKDFLMLQKLRVGRKK